MFKGRRVTHVPSTPSYIMGQQVASSNQLNISVELTCKVFILCGPTYLKAGASLWHLVDTGLF